MPVRMDRTSPLSSGLDPLSGCSQDSARPALAAVYDQIPQGKGFGGSGRRPPAQVRPGPGGQLSGRERVRHVVAGFRIEGPGDDLILPMPGYGDDRHIGHAADGQPQVRSNAPAILVPAVQTRELRNRPSCSVFYLGTHLAHRALRSRRTLFALYCCRTHYILRTHRSLTSGCSHSWVSTRHFKAVGILGDWLGDNADWLGRN